MATITTTKPTPATISFLLNGPPARPFASACWPALPRLGSPTSPESSSGPPTGSFRESTHPHPSLRGQRIGLAGLAAVERRVAEPRASVPGSRAFPARRAGCPSSFELAIPCWEIGCGPPQALRIPWSAATFRRLSLRWTNLRSTTLRRRHNGDGKSISICWG